MMIPDDWQHESSSQYTDKGSTDRIDFTDRIWIDYFENNSQLQALIEKGILSNKDLVIASSRVDRALAELRVIQPNRLPSVDINAQGNRQKINEASQTFLSSEALVDMEAEHFVIVGFKPNGDGEGGVDGCRPCQLLVGQLLTAAFHDEFLAQRRTISKHGLLKFNRNFSVLKQTSRGVNFDHRLVGKVVKFLFGRCPLSVQVVVGHVVSRVVEVATKGAAGGPPPVAAFGSQDNRDG